MFLGWVQSGVVFPHSGLSSYMSGTFQCVFNGMEASEKAPLGHFGNPPALSQGEKKSQG